MKMRLALLAIAGCVLAALAPTCEAHAFMQAPVSRVKALGRADWEAACGNGLGPSPYRAYNDMADACGDPHQDIGSLNLVNTQTAISATYSPGSIISVSVKMTVQHGGWFGVKLCNARTGLTQACFDQNPLTLENSNYQRWWITYGGGGTVYTTRWKLPNNFVCDGGCALQLTYRTANSCVDSCSSAECGSSYAARYNAISGMGPLDACSSTARTEIFRDCADIRITGTPTGTPTTTSPSTGGGSIGVGDWGQCGGKGAPCGQAGSGPCIDAAWSGYYCSTGGYSCQRSTEWWWACKPGSSPTSTPSVTVAEWGQCGGKGAPCGQSGSGPCVDAAWSGYACTSGTSCKRVSEWWWSCTK